MQLLVCVHNILWVLCSVDKKYRIAAPNVKHMRHFIKYTKIVPIGSDAKNIFHFVKQAQNSPLYSIPIIHV